MIMKKLLTGCMVALAILVALTGLAGCDQDKVLYNGRNYLMFSDTLYHYAVQESNEKLEVPVSATRRADYDRTFAVEVVDKESNAVEGKHYRLLSNTVTIKAGEVAANVEIEGVYENIGINDSLGFALRLIIPRCGAMAQIRHGNQSGDAEGMPVRHPCLYRILQGYLDIFQHLYGEYDPAPDYFRNRGRRREHDCAARTVLRRIRHQAEIQQRGYT